ncbi:hypothetical protein AAMO2058_000343100 [Amorphochlora amoebiformis]
MGLRVPLLAVAALGLSLVAYLASTPSPLSSPVRSTLSRCSTPIIHRDPPRSQVPPSRMAGRWGGGGGGGGDDEDLPADLRQATEQAGDALLSASKKGETFLRVGLLIEEMSRGAKQNQDLAEPRVLSRVADVFARKAGIEKFKIFFPNVGTSMQHKKWLTEQGSKAEISSLDRPPVLDGEELLVFVQPDIFGLKNAMKYVSLCNDLPYEDRPVVVLLNENFGEQEDKGDGFLGVPAMETVQARRLKSGFTVAYYLEQVLSRQSGIIVLFKQYPKKWRTFVADEGQYKLVSEDIKEPSEELLYEVVTEFAKQKQANKLWQSFRWKRQVEGLLENLGLPKPFQEDYKKK